MSAEQGKRRCDVLIIGAGVIGSNLAFELYKAGYDTLNVDRLPAAGYGSTAASCAIIRTHYSTWAGVAMAYEGYFYWKDWPLLLEGLAPSIGRIGPGTSSPATSGASPGSSICGGVFLGNADRYSGTVLPLFDDIGIPYEVWSAERLQQYLPGVDVGTHGSAQAG